MVGRSYDATHILGFLKDDKCGSLGFRFGSDSDLAHAAVFPKEVVQILAAGLETEILDVKDSILG